MSALRVCVTSGYPVQGGNLEAEAIVYDCWGRTVRRFIASRMHGGGDALAYVEAKAYAWIEMTPEQRDCLVEVEQRPKGGSKFYAERGFWSALGVNP